MKAISFYIVGVINAGDLNEASRILDAAHKQIGQDGRLLVLAKQYSLYELTEGEASAQAVEYLVEALDMSAGSSAHGWFSRLLSEAKAEVEP